MNVKIDPVRCAVVLVDYQERLLPAIHEGLEVVAEAGRLADCARALGIRVVGTEQNPEGLVGVLAVDLHQQIPKLRQLLGRDGTAVGEGA